MLGFVLTTNAVPRFRFNGEDSALQFLRHSAYQRFDGAQRGYLPAGSAMVIDHVLQDTGLSAGRSADGSEEGYYIHRLGLPQSTGLFIGASRIEYQGHTITSQSPEAADAYALMALVIHILRRPDSIPFRAVPRRSAGSAPGPILAAYVADIF